MQIVMAIEHTMKTPLALAVRAAGSQSAFGRLIGRRQSTVRDWLRLNKPLPAEDVFTVEAELGISRHTLRPDIYPIEHDSAPAVNPVLQIAPSGIPVESNALAVAA